MNAGIECGPLQGSIFEPHKDSVRLIEGKVRVTSASTVLRRRKQRRLEGSVPVTERVFLRVNADFLNNVFNMPGTNLPGGDGIILNRTSANAPRVLQLTMRLTW